MKIDLTVCDVCKDQRRPTRTYRVTSEGRTATTDRCEEHGAEFEALFGEKAPTSRRRGRRPRITTIEEIEAKKKTRD